MELPNDILRAPAGEAARRIALALLDRGRGAAVRWSEAEDGAALHDFRVAVRRLRSHLRAYEPELSSDVRKKHRRRLRRIQAATGSGRDAEVGLEWLESQELEAAQRAGRDWITAELERRRQAAERSVRESATSEFAKLDSKLRPQLLHWRADVELGSDESRTFFASELARLLRAHAGDLAQHLAAVTSASDREQAHTSRIRTKRLRYLAEPAAARLPEARALVADLQRLQDLLGKLNDAHVLGAELDEAQAQEDGERGAPPADARAGLLELAMRAEEERERLFAELAREWLGTHAAGLAERVSALAAALEREARRGIEIERKFLLSGMPRVPASAVYLEIEQGWLPGKELRERVRKTRGPHGTAYHRAVKLGRGLVRTEVEEEAAPEVFAALWPLTAGCRVHKRRTRVDEGDLVWEIDEFHGRELVLAEVELADPSQPAHPPEWLAPFVVREVTDEPGFTNLELAR